MESRRQLDLYSDCAAAPPPPPEQGIRPGLSSRCGGQDHLDGLIGLHISLDLHAITSSSTLFVADRHGARDRVVCIS